MRDIIDGWFNYLKYWLGFESRGLYKLAKYRGKICDRCEHKKRGVIYFDGYSFGYKCDLCGCMIEPKIRCEDCVCPDVRW